MATENGTCNINDGGGGEVKTRRKNKYAYACAMLASMSSILLGYDVGVMSGAAIFIQKEWKTSEVKIEVLMGIINLYSLFGSAAAGRTSDWIGRRYTIVLAGGIFFVGAVLMGFATNYVFLMVARFVAGIGVGYALMIAPVYTAELAPTASRGFLTSFPEVFINAGVLLGYVSNFAFSKLPLNLGWRLMLGAGALPSILLAAGGLFMPESPRWLVMQGRLADAKAILHKTSDSPAEAELRLADIKSAAGIPADCTDDVVAVGAAAGKKRGSSGEGVWKELLLRPTPAVRRVMVAALGIHFFQQASGIDSVVLYSPRIFAKAGIHSNNRQLGTTVAVGFTKTAFILVSTFFLDKVGRRPLLLASTAGMLASLVGLGTGLTIVDQHPDEKLVWAVALSIICTLAFVGFFSMGLGPIAWVYSSEIFPLRLRAQGVSMGAAMNRIMSGTVAMTFISLYHAITIGGSFFLYGGIVAVAWVFFYTFLPETRGRTLEEMDVLFQKSFRGRPAAAGEVAMAPASVRDVVAGETAGKSGGDGKFGDK